MCVIMVNHKYGQHVTFHMIHHTIQPPRPPIYTHTYVYIPPKQPCIHTRMYPPKYPQIFSLAADVNGPRQRCIGSGLCYFSISALTMASLTFLVGMALASGLAVPGGLFVPSILVCFLVSCWCVFLCPVGVFSCVLLVCFLVSCWCVLVRW